MSRYDRWRLSPPEQPKRVCDLCGEYCQGSDEHTYRSKPICDACLLSLEEDGIIIGHCVRCGDFIDSEDVQLYTANMDRVCQKCFKG